MDYSKCTTSTMATVIVVEENRSKLIVNNSGKRPLNKIKVDGCLISQEHEKCDWLVATTDVPLRALYIELKGCDVKKAVSQLKNTVKLTEATFKDHGKECYAITTRVPKHGTDIRKLAMDFYKETKATLSVKNVQCSVEI